MKPNFDIELLPEGIEFLENLVTKNFSKKLNDFIGSFGHRTTAFHISFFHNLVATKNKKLLL